MKKLTLALPLIALYLGSIVLANYVVERYGVVPIGFGLMAPAAVYVVGVTLVLRDLLQRRIGAWPTAVLILVGAGLSWFVSPTLALASGAAFLASELVDLLVFSATQRFGMLRAVVASNAVSLVVDSVVFLLIGFGSLEFLPGQIVGKALATMVAVGLLAVLHNGRRETVTA